MINLDRLKQEKSLGCGCSTFGGSLSKKNALRTLGLCFDEDIFYYDVARSYGYGEAERIVGEFIKDKRAKVIVSSKFGIEASRSFPFKKTITSTARFIKSQIPGSKKMLQKVSSRALTKTKFTPEMVVNSLNKSLSELRTDYLDLFVYHEASFEEMLNADVLAILEREKDKGKIRAFGANLSHNIDQNKLLESNFQPAVLQLPLAFNHAFDRLINKENQINIVYSIMNLFKQLDQEQILFLKKMKSEYLSEVLENELETLLYLTLNQMKSGVLLMSASNQNHIKRNVQIAKLKTLEGASKIDLSGIIL